MRKPKRDCSVAPWGRISSRRWGAQRCQRAGLRDASSLAVIKPTGFVRTIVAQRAQAGRGKSATRLADGLLTPPCPRGRGSVAGFGQPSGRGVAVDLQPGDAQTRDAVGFDRALPRKEFLYRELVASANFLETDGAAAHGIDDHGLTPGDPAFGVRGRQVNDGGAGARQDLAPKQIVQPNVVVHRGTINLETLKNP